MKDDELKKDFPQVIVKFELGKDFRLHTTFSFKTPCDIYGELHPSHRAEGNDYGSIYMRVESRLTFEFLETLQKAIDAFRAELKNHAN